MVEDREPYLYLYVPGEPVPKDRPRVGPSGGHTTDRTKEAEADIRGRILGQLGQINPDPISAFEFHGHFYTQSRTKDVDNLVKLCMDALNKYIWEDDRQVSDLQAKIYRQKVVVPATVIYVFKHDYPWDRDLPGGVSNERRVPSNAEILSRAQWPKSQRSRSRSRR